MIDGVHFQTKHPVRVLFKKYRCSKCGDIMSRKWISSVISTDSEEGKKLDTWAGDVGIAGRYRVYKVLLECSKCGLTLDPESF